MWSGDSLITDWGPTKHTSVVIDVAEIYSLATSFQRCGLGRHPKRIPSVAARDVESYSVHRQIQCLKGGDHADARGFAYVLRAFGQHRGFTGSRM